MTDVILCATSNLFRIYVIYRFMKVLLGNFQISNIIGISIYGIFYLVNTLSFLIFHLSWINVLCNLMGISVIAYFHTHSIKSILFATFSIITINMTCDAIVVLLFVNYEEGGNFNQLFNLIAVLFTFISELVIEKILDKRENRKDVQYVALILIPLCSVVINIILVYTENITYLGLIIINMAFLIINFLVFYLYDKLSIAFTEKYENIVLQQKLKGYVNQMKMAMKSEEAAKSLRHDMKHHMNEIKLMAMQNRTIEIQDYIDAMQEFASNPEEIVSSGNWEIDSILNYMLQQAKKELCSVEIQVQLPEKFLHTFDLNVILGNLIENAIEGAKQSVEKRLKVNIIFRRGTLQIEIENSFNGKMYREQGHFLTTKVEKEVHGIGLSNVKKIIEKYNGVLEMHSNKTTFYVKALLYVHRR